MKRLVYRLGWILGDNNGRCLALWIITGILLLVAIFSGFGEPILTQTLEKKISEAPSKYHKSVYDAWYGPEKTKVEAKGKKWPVEKKWPSLVWSWKWWLSFILFFFISLIYTPIAFREEARETWEEAWRKIREKDEAEAKTKKNESAEGSKASPESSQSSATGGRGSFARLFSIDLLAEFAWEFLQKIFTGIVRRR